MDFCFAKILKAIFFMITGSKGGRRLKQTDQISQPLVSIITVVFRARQDLPGLLDSIIRLKDDSVELIVVDGGSDDGTCELLREYDSQIDYWLSEPDGGIYDAMNKGVAAARGTFLLHLNAGDRLVSIPRQELEEAALKNIEVVAFRVSIDGQFEFEPSRGIALRLNNTLHHQGTFFRRETFPAYDPKYKVFGDFDVNQRLAIRGAKMEVFDQVVALHTRGGISAISDPVIDSEFFGVIEKNYGRHYLPVAWFLCKWRGLKARLGLF
jgi:glycosyltransferase involved in cell wall biosynthesis